MRGKLKLERNGAHGKYKVFFKNWPWQPWKPFYDGGKQLEFTTLQEFSELTCIESWDRITMRISKFSGLGRK